MRIEPVQPPYDEHVAGLLERMVPPGVKPIHLFRTFVRNPTMTEAMTGWGRYELSADLSLSLRDREILIDRTCVRCRCEYEWGVHVAYFAEKAGFTESQLTSLTHGAADDPCWTGRERLLVRFADALHDRADVEDDLWTELRSVLSEPELLDAVMLCGWYHAICYAANAARVARESWAPRFADVAAD